MAEKLNSNGQNLSLLSKGILVFLAYIVFAKIGLSIYPVSGFASVVWPPTGIAIASLLLFGLRLWPAIALGAFLINFYTGANFFAASAIALGNTLEAVVAVYLLQKLDFNPLFEKIRDVVLIFLVAGAGATLISASIGVGSLYLAGTVSAQNVAQTWISWWVGDMLGATIFAPFILIWFKKGFSNPLNRNDLVEFAAWVFVSSISAIFVFDQLLWGGLKNHPIAFLVFPTLAWGAIRFGQRTTISAAIALDLFAIWGTYMEAGPFYQGDVLQSLLFSQLFAAAVTFTSLLLNTSVLELRGSKEKISQLNEELKQKVREVERLNRLMVNQIKESRNDAVKAIREVSSKR